MARYFPLNWKKCEIGLQLNFHVFHKQQQKTKLQKHVTIAPLSETCFSKNQVPGTKASSINLRGLTVIQKRSFWSCTRVTVTAHVTAILDNGLSITYGYLHFYFPFLFWWQFKRPGGVHLITWITFGGEITLENYFSGMMKEELRCDCVHVVLSCNNVHIECVS